MNPNPFEIVKTGRGWLVLGEFAQPPRVDKKEWVTTDLMVALDTIHMPPSDLERLKITIAEAVERHAVAEQDRQALIVRVLISWPVEVGTVPNCWGFFIIDRAAGEAESAELDRADEQPTVHFIEIYVYGDTGPA